MRGHRIWQVVVDAVLIAFAYWLAFFIRFDTGTPAFYQRTMFQTIGMVTLIQICTYVATGVYNKWWRYLSVKDMEGVLRSVTLGWALSLVYTYFALALQVSRIPRSVAVLDFAFTLFLVAGVRFAARSFFERPGLRNGSLIPPSGQSVLIAGAGEAGRVIIREMQRHQLGLIPVGLVDDDERKHAMRLDGVQVLGTTGDIPEIIANTRVDEVVIAMPSATGETIARVVGLCRDQGVKCRILPSIHELVLGNRNLTGQLRTVQVEDVLGREPVKIDLKQIASYLTDQVVLVTGAGGSIGSELVRQIARVNPSQLVLVDHSEHNLFLIEQELLNERDFHDITPVLASVTSEPRMREVFTKYQPKVVFHAAAYKHVTMVEHNPVEAVRNNVLATRTLCEVAERSGVERFVLVSTDKAVEPETVMGQSKALCEWIVQSFAARSFHTRYMAVRFGNVLGSSGSVIPIFRRQIERGGPVTVTDEKMTRFFMTIPEAAQLIIQAGAIGEGSEIFVLDMGKPVRIVDLARNMIELSGRTPGVDIEIEFVGLRPGGEKMDEVLFAGDETVERTGHEKIWLSKSSHRVDADKLLEELDTLGELLAEGRTDDMQTKLRAITQPRIDAGARETPMSPV
jgi:FlaA1/EpsC-like NDP-sugar epimerase